MKKAFMSIGCALIIIIFFLMFFTIQSRSLRQTELDNAMRVSMERVIETLLVEEGGPRTEEGLEILFINSLVMQINSESNLSAKCKVVDIEKGIISAEAVLTFQYPIGTQGSVSSTKNIILEEYIEE